MSKKNQEHHNERAGYKLSKTDKIITKGDKALINIFIDADIHGSRIPPKDLVDMEFGSQEDSKNNGKNRSKKVRKMKKSN